MCREGIKMSIYITGDTHRDFEKIYYACEELETTPDDIMIILGDAGINYYLDESDEELKEELRDYPITLFIIHGNHEEYPSEIDSYEIKRWHGGLVYYEEEYPNLLFAIDGEIYDFGGITAIAIGGAYSVDKYARLASGEPWFDTEQPSEETKAYVESQLDKVNWHVDIVLSHTAPKKYEPTHAFIPGLNQNIVDKSTEEWLDTIEERLDYDRWYCGHYHIDDEESALRIMYYDIEGLEDADLF